VTNTLNFIFAFIIGALLGTIFFGGLWLTIQRGLSSHRSSLGPPLWFFGSLLIRMCIVLTGFYFVGRNDWERLLLCLLGFLIARLTLSHVIRGMKRPTDLGQETHHAS
jgi:F1F0 ATPase subunit 2